MVAGGGGRGAECGRGLSTHRRDACATAGRAFGSIGDDVAQRGEGLGVEFFVYRVAASGVDALHAGEGFVVEIAAGDFVEIGEGEAVGLADEDRGHRGVEKVLEEGWGEGWTLMCVAGCWRRPLRSAGGGPLSRRRGGGECVGCGRGLCGVGVHDRPFRLVARMCGVMDAGVGIVLGALGGSRVVARSDRLSRTNRVDARGIFDCEGVEEGKEGTERRGREGHAEDAEKRGVWGGPMETGSPSGLGVG